MYCHLDSKPRLNNSVDVVDFIDYQTFPLHLTAVLKHNAYMVSGKTLRGWVVVSHLWCVTVQKGPRRERVTLTFAWLRYHVRWGSKAGKENLTKSQGDKPCAQVLWLLDVAARSWYDSGFGSAVGWRVYVLLSVHTHQNTINKYRTEWPHDVLEWLISISRQGLKGMQGQYDFAMYDILPNKLLSWI